MPLEAKTKHLTIHGHRVAYRTAGEGDGPVVVLVHGITSTSAAIASPSC